MASYDLLATRGMLLPPRVTAGGGGDTTPPSVTLTAPNGGQSWQVGSVQIVTWTATDTVGVTSIDLYYSTAGAAGPWTEIATGEVNDGTYSWAVPDDVSTNCYVKVVAKDAALNAAEDISDSAFEIAAAGSAATTQSRLSPIGVAMTRAA